jgi:hypothetical protein
MTIFWIFERGIVTAFFPSFAWHQFIRSARMRCRSESSASRRKTAEGMIEYAAPQIPSRPECPPLSNQPKNTGPIGPSHRAPRFPRRAGCAPAQIGSSQSLRDQPRAHILSARSQDAARAPVVAPRRSFRPAATAAGNSLKIEATIRHKLAKPKCCPVSKFPLGSALRPVGFRCVETHQPEGLAGYADCVAVQHLNLPGTKRGSVCNRGDKGEN